MFKLFLLESLAKMPSVDPGYKCAWLIWSAAFLVPWAMLFFARPALRRCKLWCSVLTAPFALTEPLFVPEYWNPPSLFDLAHRTGFDTESLVFSFVIGGLAVAGYRALAPAPERSFHHRAYGRARHRWHTGALLSPFIVFVALLPLPWNACLSLASLARVRMVQLVRLSCRLDRVLSLWLYGVYAGVSHVFIHNAVHRVWGRQQTDRSSTRGLGSMKTR